MDRDPDFFPPLRALRRALVVAEMRHLTQAAHALRRSQSAVTRSIAGLERYVRAQLFERTVTGMASTAHGSILFARVRLAVDHLARAEAKLLAAQVWTGRAKPSPGIFRLEISNASVFAFLAVHDQRDVGQAARSLGISVGTVRRLVREFEQQVAARLFERETHRTVRPTPAALLLGQHLKLALWEIRAGLDELAGGDGEISGTVKIGVMSTARSVVVPRAISYLHRMHPRVLVRILLGNRANLRAALTCGDVDFIVGALRAEDSNSPECEVTALVQDEVVIVARAGHPLASAKEVGLADLVGLGWVLPPGHFELRSWLRRELERHKLHEPNPLIETASLAIFRGVLLETDCVALSTRLQCWHEIVQYGVLRVLPVVGLADAQRRAPFHLHVSRRSGVTLSPAANALFCAVIDAARELRRSSVEASGPAGLSVRGTKRVETTGLSFAVRADDRSE